MAAQIKVRDEFGVWIIGRDEDGNLVARQGDTEVLLLDPADFARFGLEMAA